MPNLPPLPPLPSPPHRNNNQSNGSQNPQPSQPQDVSPDAVPQSPVPGSASLPGVPQRPVFPGQVGGQQAPAFPPSSFPRPNPQQPQQPVYGDNQGYPQQAQQGYQNQPQRPFNPAYDNAQSSQPGYQSQQVGFPQDPYSNQVSSEFNGNGSGQPLRSNKKLTYGLISLGVLFLIIIIIAITVVVSNAGKSSPTPRETGGTSQSSKSPAVSTKDYTIDGKGAVLAPTEVINYNLSTTSTGWKEATPSDATKGETDYKTADGKCNLLLYQTYIDDVNTSKGDLQGTYNLFDVGTGSVVTAAQAEADSKSDYITTTSGDQVEIKVLNEKNTAGDEVYVAGRAFSSSKVGFIEVMRCDAGTNAVTQWNKTLDGSELSIYAK